MFQFEKVESRQMFSFTITEVTSGNDNPITAKLSKTGVLTITGTADKDSIILEQSILENELRLTNAGGVDFLASYGRRGNKFDLSLVKKIVVNAGGGRDYVKVSTAKRGVTAQIDGGSANDTIVADVKNSTIRGGAGNDYIISGQEQLPFTLRVVTARYAAGTTLPLSESFFYVPDGTITRAGMAVAGNLVYPNTATNFKALLDASHNVVEGGSGDDRISTRGGEDSIYGGDGNDTITKLNNVDTYLSDLPALAEPATTTNDGPARATLFGIEAILGPENFSGTVNFRRNTILEA